MALLILALVGLMAFVGGWVSSSLWLLVVAIAVCVILVLAAVVMLPARLVARDTGGAALDTHERASAVNGARTTLVQGIVGLLALAGVFVAWQQFQTDREQSRTDRQQLREQLTLTRQGQVDERFTRALDQLGSDRLEQRLGGIYGLERIAKDSPDGNTRLVVAEVLTAYVRQHAPRDKADPLFVDPRQLGGLETRAPDLQAIMTVLGRRITVATDPPLNLHDVDLRRANLRGASLQRVNFEGAYLLGANLDGAQLQGAIFSYAGLEGASLNNAQLQGASLIRARLQGARLNGAQLQRVRMYDAALGGASLNQAQLQNATVNDSDLGGARLDGAQLQGANFNYASLQGADLRRAQLQGAILNSANLHGAKADQWTAWPNDFDWRAAGVELQ